MNALLFKLLILRLRGSVRRRLRELRTRRGVFFLLVTLAVIALIKMAPSLPNPLPSLSPGGPAVSSGQTAQYMPVGLLAAFLLTVFLAPGLGVSFSPPEINLLFSGPFTRRALIFYKLGSYAFGVLLSSLLITLLMPASACPAAAAFFGTFLTLLFIQLLTLAAGLLGRLAERYFHAGLKSLVIAAILIFAAIGWYNDGASSGLKGLLDQFQSSAAGAVLLAPFKVFANIFLSETFFPGLLMWATLGMAINAGLVSAVILLDRHVEEELTARGLEFHKRRDRTRGGGQPWRTRALTARSSGKPPMLGGIGPVAWRQVLSALRGSGSVLLTLFALAFIAGPLLAAASASISPLLLTGAAFSAAVFVLPKTLVFDFRGDLDNMPNLKGLPLAAWKICIGQLAAPVLLTIAIELVLLISAMTCLDGPSRFFLMAVIPFLLPFNVLLYGVENLFFLLFPAPLVPVGRADYDFIGRTIVGSAVTVGVLTAGCLLAAGTGYLASTLIGMTWPVFVTAACLFLFLLASMALPLLSRAFSRFDAGRLSGPQS